MCLVLSWRTEFFEIYIAYMLSVNNNIGVGIFTCKSFKRVINQRIFAIVVAMDMYSDSIELLDTVGYFLDFQLIKDSSRNM